MAGQTVVVSVLADTKKFSKAFKGLSRDSGLTSLAKGLGSLVGTAVKTVAGIGAAVGGLAVAGGFSRALKIDEAKTKLEALGYTGKQLDTIMENALNSVKGTSFGLDSAATVAAQALAAGVKPGKELEAQLTTVANTAALAGVDMGEMGSIFGKVWANGKVTTQEMNQLADRGIPIWTTLSEAFGVSTDELRKMISKGEVTADMFTGALGPAVEGMAERMGGSFKGMAANAMAALSRLGAMFAGPLLEAAKPWLKYLTENIDKVAGMLQPFADKFAGFLKKLSPDRVIPLVKEFLNFGKSLTDLSGPFETVRGIIDRFAPIFGAIAGAMAPLMKHLPLIGKFLPAIGGPLGIVIGLIAGMVAGSEDLQNVLGQFVQALAPVLMQIFEALAPVIAAVAEVLTDVVAVVADALVPIIEALIPIIKLVGDLFVALSPILVTLVGAVGGLVKAIAPVIQIIAEALVPVIEGLAKVLGGLIDFIVGVFTGDWKKAWSGIKKVFSGIWDAIVGIFKGAWDLIKGIFGPAIEFISNATKNFTKGMKKGFSDWASDTGSKIKSTWDNVKSWTRDTWNNATSAVKSGWQGIKSGIADGTRTTLSSTKSWMSNVGNGIKNGWNSVTRVFTSMPSRIRGALTSAGTWLLTTGRQIITGLANGIRNGISSVISAITNVVRGAISAGKRLLGIHSPSRVFRDIGKFTVRGLEDGLGGPNKIGSAMRKLTGQVENGFDPTLALSTRAGRGHGAPVTINVNAGVGDPVEIGRQVSAYVRDYERAGGVFA